MKKIKTEKTVREQMEEHKRIKEWGDKWNAKQREKIKKKESKK